MLEHLETRRLFSVISLSHGILKINGTEGDDVVTVARQTEADTTASGQLFFDLHLIFTLNGTQIGDYAAKDLTVVKANLMAGDDSMIVGHSTPVAFDIDGGDGNDTLSGGLRNDTLRGGAGDNYMAGGKGNDHFICNGDSDTVIGGLGNDTADFSNQTVPLNISLDDVANDGGMSGFGNVASDVETIVGGGGADTISAAGIDHVVSIMGMGGDDKLYGGFKNDTLKGGSGNDDLYGSSGNDYLNGNGGEDKLFGQDGDDTLNGGAGDPAIIPIPTPAKTPSNDTLFTDDETTVPDTGGAGDGSEDVLDGGAGNDVFLSDAFDVTVIDITKKVSHPEPMTGTRNFVFTVSLDAKNFAPITVDYATADGTAIAGTNYTAESGTLTFAIGQTSQTITVPVIGGNVVAADETFFVNLTNVQGSAVLNTTQGEGLITP